ncbi:MAG: hypothetical protein WC372_01000 [Candidatus Neomarinimicrobiota bacterium]|jgi:glutamate-5-semialdehyde dehydrogenase|nr:hypothetical protein [Candidatus Neomarinimicrobiota bacterium]MDX9780271.1 hypothetical protein [bacterium]
MTSIRHLAEKAKAAALLLRLLDTEKIRQILSEMSTALLDNQKIILRLNRQDLENGKAMRLSDSMIDRLFLNEERLRHITGLLPRLGADKEIEQRFARLIKTDCQFPCQPSVAGLIFESCPYITILSPLFALTARMSVILRGGKEAFHSNTAIVSILCDILEKNGLPREIVALAPTTDRVAMAEMLQLPDLIDLIIPQGSEGLLKYVNNNSRIPVVKSYTGFIDLCLDQELSDQEAIQHLLPF